MAKLIDLEAEIRENANERKKEDLKPGKKKRPVRKARPYCSRQR